jgi:D-aspartate ligase
MECMMPPLKTEKFMPHLTPTVVIGATLNGLGVVRSLARGNVPAILVDTTRARAAMWSRCSQAAVIEQLHGRKLIDALLAIRKKQTDQPVLILTDKLAVKSVSEHRDELRPAYRFQLPPQNIVAILQNRRRFHAFANEHGLPVPRMMLMNCDTPLEKLASMSFPVLVRVAKHRNEPASGRHTFFAASLHEAEKLCRLKFESAEELVVEEWIEGPDSNVCFSQFYFGNTAEAFKVFAGRKLASSPAKIGNAALCLAAPEVLGALEPLIAKFLDLTDFRGLGRIEFKWDAQQRRYIILKATAGYAEWQDEIACLSGVNLPLAAYRDEVGLPALITGKIDRTVAWRESALLVDKLPALSPSMRVYDGYWRLSDPMPGIFHYFHTEFGWVYRKVALKLCERIMSRYMRPALERIYQTVVRTISHFGKASPR